MKFRGYRSQPFIMPSVGHWSWEWKQQAGSGHVIARWQLVVTAPLQSRRLGGFFLEDKSLSELVVLAKTAHIGFLFLLNVQAYRTPRGRSRFGRELLKSGVVAENSRQ